MTDLEIAGRVNPVHIIKEIAAKLNIPEDELEFYGKHKAKLPLSLIDTEKIDDSNLILITAIPPTPAWEGKKPLP